MCRGCAWKEFVEVLVCLAEIDLVEESEQGDVTAKRWWGKVVSEQSVKFGGACCVEEACVDVVDGL